MTPARSSTARKRLADSREEPASCARSAWVAVTSTSGHVLAGRDLLLDELAEDDRDPALDGLEGLAREALVHLAQAPAEGDDEAHRDLGVFAHQPAHIAAEDADDARRLDRLDRRRAQLVLEHRELAEDVARPERRERDHAPVRVRADRTRRGPRARCSRCRSHRPRGRPPAPARTSAAPPPRRYVRGRCARASRKPARARAARRPQLSGSLASPTGYHTRPQRIGTGRENDAPALSSHCAHTIRRSRDRDRSNRGCSSPSAALAAPAATQRASAHALLSSHELWATIDVCNPADQANTVGIRGSMPGDGESHDRMYMSFRLQYMDATSKQWANLAGGSSPGFVAVGGGGTSRQDGRVFTLVPAAGTPPRSCVASSTFSGARAGRSCSLPRGRRPPGTSASLAPTRPDSRPLRA